MASDLTSDTFLASKKISDEIKADLAVHPEKYTMLTGDRPTGRLHMGHYFGTIRERVALQNAGVTTRIIIADYQVITDRDTTANIADNVHNMVIDYLACGIDPEKTIIFTHSAVPALNQLMLPFLSLVTESELMRNPTVKAEQEASGHALTGLLLSYPVHQACDILFCKGNVVPVGKDQLPHIEQTRQIARRFNERYGRVFPEPHGLLTDAVEIPGLDGRKMSKSYGNAIALSATEEETAKLIKKSQTDSERMITFDKENRPGVSALLTTAALTTGRTEQDIAAEIGNDGAGARDPARGQPPCQRDRQHHLGRGARGHGHGVLAAAGKLIDTARPRRPLSGGGAVFLYGVLQIHLHELDALAHALGMGARESVVLVGALDLLQLEGVGLALDVLGAIAGLDDGGHRGPRVVQRRHRALVLHEHRRRVLGGHLA